MVFINCSYDPANGAGVRHEDAGKVSSLSGGSSSTTGVTRNRMEAQLVSLRTAVGQLRNAYNGLDVVWSDDGELKGKCMKEEMYSESGSWSRGDLIRIPNFNILSLHIFQKKPISEEVALEVVIPTLTTRTMKIPVTQRTMMMWVPVITVGILPSVDRTAVACRRVISRRLRMIIWSTR